jgi:hypothetical protein
LSEWRRVVEVAGAFGLPLPTLGSLKRSMDRGCLSRVLLSEHLGQQINLGFSEKLASPTLWPSRPAQDPCFDEALFRNWSVEF